MGFKRTAWAVSALGLGVIFAAGALVDARPAEAGTTVNTHFLLSGLVPVAATGERADLRLVNQSPYARSVKLELVDKDGGSASTTITVIDPNEAVSVTLDPTKFMPLRGRILLNQQQGETEILCDAFVASLAIVATGSTPRTKVYVGEFNHYDP